ncbi:unnamed protein product [Penicillium roqueforti FM164]|uniref:Genomic scaffold, ProqFM164S01 n=1 Tax=Penicillium roqueforti (strain FM164) TaxID=1365484 RepID=W6Q0Q5_PENRF|nr:unnamed protein product [Penicillium roqueforti FM164]
MNSTCGYIHIEEGQDRLTVYLALELGIGLSDTTKGNVSALVPLESLTDTFTGITLSLVATTRPNFSRQFLRSAVSDTEKDLKCCQLMIQCYPRTNCIHTTRNLV